MKVRVSKTVDSAEFSLQMEALLQKGFIFIFSIMLFKLKRKMEKLVKLLSLVCKPTLTQLSMRNEVMCTFICFGYGISFF